MCEQPVERALTHIRAGGVAVRCQSFQTGVIDCVVGVEDYIQYVRILARKADEAIAKMGKVQSPPCEASRPIRS
jgi:hypothetical protein